MPRKADVKSCLESLGISRGFQVEIREVDIERSNQDDLSSSSLWDELFGLVSEGAFDVVVMSPPCNSFSRARQTYPGPRPVRSAGYPWGFPWLSNANKEFVECHNFFIRKTSQLCHHAYEHDTRFLVEHPEDLGAVRGERPASIWQLPEVRDLVYRTSATTWAIHQCEFGADTLKPTRFLSDIPEAAKEKHQGWPQFDQ